MDELNQPVTEPASRRRVFILSTLVVLATATLYARTYRFDFIDYDDYGYVFKNATVLSGISWSNLRWAFTTSDMCNWHPLTWIVYLVTARFAGLHAGIYHLVNVGFHILASLTLFLTLHAMTQRPGRSAVTALLFALHPMHVESVAWVSELKDVLSVFIGFTAIAVYVRYARHGGTMRYLGVLGLFALSLMAKPMLVSLPLLLWCLDYWPLNRLFPSARGLTTEKFGSKPVPLSRVILEKLPMFVMSAAICLVTSRVQNTEFAPSLTLGLRLQTAVLAYATYLHKAILPVKLGVLYPHPLLLGMPMPTWKVAVAGTVLLAISIVAVQQRHRRRYFLVGWLWFLISLLPVIGLVQVGYQWMADRYSYLPLVGIFIAVIWAGAEVFQRLKLSRSVRTAIAGLICMIYACLAWRQVGYWQDTLTIFTRTMQVTERNFVAASGIGGYYNRHEQPALAAPFLEKAVAWFPDHPTAHSSLGVSYQQLGRLNEAIEQGIIAIRVAPDDAGAHNNLGNALAAAGRKVEAISQYRKAIQLDPRLPGPHHNLPMLLAEQGNDDEAIAHWRQAIQLDPNYVNALNSLALALQRRGDSEGAIEYFRRALVTGKTTPEAKGRLAWLLATRPSASLDDIALALNLAREVDDAHGRTDPLDADTLAAAMSRSSEWDAAVAMADRAVQQARDQHNQKLSEKIEQRREMYRSHQPFVRPGP